MPLAGTDAEGVSRDFAESFGGEPGMLVDTRYITPHVVTAESATPPRSGARNRRPRCQVARTGREPPRGSTASKPYSAASTTTGTGVATLDTVGKEKESQFGRGAPSRARCAGCVVC